MLPYGAAGSTRCAAELLNTAPHVMWMRSYGLILKEGEIFHIVLFLFFPATTFLLSDIALVFSTFTNCPAGHTK